MPDRPIINAASVRAILVGRKTQTRRILKPQPDFRGGRGDENDPESWGWEDEYGDHVPVTGASSRYLPGDRLWVREAWRAWSEFDALPPRDIPPGVRVQYLADDPVSPWDSRYRHARFMPRWASRLTLLVKSVRVERVQDISEADAIAEGVAYECPQFGYTPQDAGLHMDHRICERRGGPHMPSHRELFANAWNSIHGEGAWDRNDWVAAVEFDAVERNIGEVSDDRA